jgi:2-methylcitrate dehydratase PrpD
MALINATAGHALDYDDVTDEVQGHPSTVLVPAALAVGEEVGASGRKVLEAYLVGYHTQYLLCTIIEGPRHYALGWHATSTIGVFGAAAAASYIYGLDAEQTTMALAIAGSMSGGSRRNFGTMTKPLHAGLAASRGIEAAQLARAGFTGGETLLEAPLGFIDLFGDDTDLSRADTVSVDLHALGSQHFLSVKKYPCCYNTHRAIDLVLDTEPIAPERIVSIAMTVHPSGLGPLIHHRPVTGLQGKFSLEYTVAAAMIDRQVSMASFEDAAVNRPDVQALLRKVSSTASSTPSVGSPEWAIGFACMSVTLDDGTVIEGRVDQPRGHSDSPLSDAELHRKFDDCVRFATGVSQPELLQALDRLRSLDSVADLPLPDAAAFAARASLLGAAS